MSGSEFRRTVVRAQDLLVLELHFHNLALDPTGLQLLPTGAGEPLIVAHLPPQHLAEEAYGKDVAVEVSEEAVAARSRIAGPSRIAFRVPSLTEPIPLQLDSLLGLLATYELRVVDAALPRSDDPSPPGCLVGLVPWLNSLTGGPDPALRAPTLEETSLEFPWRLILSPPGHSGFAHLPEPFPADTGRTELWHSQLGVAPGTLGSAEADERSVRAVWLRTNDLRKPFQPEPMDLPPGVTDPEFRTTLLPLDRYQIVHLSADFRARRSSQHVAIYPKAIPVHRFAVSSLGATVDLHGEWAPPKELSLGEWVHRTSVSRDTFVRLVDFGWLFPFMHRARLVRIFERKFDTGPSQAALIRERMFVVPLERLRTYEMDEAPNPQLGRTMPLRRVEVRTLSTPNLQLPVNIDVFEIRKDDGQPFLFHLQGADRLEGGREVDFRIPLWFVRQEADVGPAVNGFAEVALLDGAGDTDSGGVPLDVVGDPGSTQGDSTWRIRSIDWRGVSVSPGTGAVPQAPFYPAASSVALRMPAVEVIAGAKALADASYHQRYIDHGLNQNQNPGALVFGLSSKVDLGFAGKGDRSGGLVRPELQLTGLSRTIGPVAGPKIADIASGAFNPSDFFGGASPKLFGTIPLDRVLAATGLVDGGKARAPRIQIEPDESATLRWEPQLRNYPDDAPVFVASSASRLSVLVKTPASPRSTVASTIECVLESFAIHLVPGFQAIELDFDRASFIVKNGKPDVDVRLSENGIRFVGALSFVETLTRIIPLDGFSDPPTLQVTPSEAEASFAIGVPSLTLGIFSLENISFGAGFLIPFDQRSMSVEFNFCKRNEPFLLTVSALGGGGFFAIEVDAAGVQRLEAALEFGASLSMNFGVASGGVHVMAGIYFSYETSKGAALTGYFRVGGNVTALGLVSVSIELYLALTYEFASGKAVGVATLTIEIEVFLFSASVELRCERKFAGSTSDPSFMEVMQPYDAAIDPGVATHPVGLQLADGDWPFEDYWAAYA
jgi:hypothetical protein